MAQVYALTIRGQLEGVSSWRVKQDLTLCPLCRAKRAKDCHRGVVAGHTRGIAVGGDIAKGSDGVQVLRDGLRQVVVFVQLGKHLEQRHSARIPPDQHLVHLLEKLFEGSPSRKKGSIWS